MQRPRRPKPRGVGIIEGGPSDASENVERYLGEMGFGKD
jgi:hypothetical protein